MKKRLLFISLTLVLALTVLAPAPALAKHDKWGNGFESSEPTIFSATADVMVTDPGRSTQNGLEVTTRGERIQGVFTAVDGWPELLGASLKVRHNSVITLSPTSETEGTFSGNASALIVVSLGNGRLFGIYKATLTGEYMLMGEQLVVKWVMDVGTFKAIGRILDDGRTFVKAKGDWNATLLLTPVDDTYTLAGDAQISGEYQKFSRKR